MSSHVLAGWLWWKIRQWQTFYSNTILTGDVLLLSSGMYTSQLMFLLHIRSIWLLRILLSYHTPCRQYEDYPVYAVPWFLRPFCHCLYQCLVGSQSPIQSCLPKRRRMTVEAAPSVEVASKLMTSKMIPAASTSYFHLKGRMRSFDCQDASLEG